MYKRQLSGLSRSARSKFESVFDGSRLARSEKNASGFKLDGKSGVLRAKINSDGRRCVGEYGGHITINDRCISYYVFNRAPVNHTKAVKQMTKKVVAKKNCRSTNVVRGNDWHLLRMR